MSYQTKRKGKTDHLKRKSFSKGNEDEILVTSRDLPVLRRKRTIALNRLKRILDAAFFAKADSSGLDYFLAHFSTMQKVCKNFEEAHFDILSIIDSDAEEEEDAIRKTFDDIHIQIMTMHRKLTSHSDSEQNDETDHNRSFVSNVKLPKINIPTFSGVIKEWPKFYDLFNSLIHNNKSFSDSERMHFLISSLSGDALALIRTYPAQGSFYTEAYKTLTTRYQDTRELAFTCWKEILDVNLKSNSPFEFRRALDLIVENLTILKGLSLPTKEWDFIMCYHILSKLDSPTRCAYERQNTSSELPKYDELLKFLYSKCDALVRDTHFSSQNRSQSFSNRPQEKPQSQSKVNDNKATKSKLASVFFSNANNSKSKINTQAVNSLPAPIKSNPPPPPPRPALEAPSPVLKCSFCSGTHAINQCKRFEQISVVDRIAHAKDRRWCFNCLKPSHSLKDCKSIFKCQKCHQRHHTLLHLDQIEPPPSPTPSPRFVTGGQAEHQVSVLTNLGDSSVVLLSTAIVQVRDTLGNFQSLRALIDSGSQAHFITERAAERLGVVRNFTSRRVRGLGQSSSAVTGTVQIEVGTNGQSLFIVDALTLPTICGKMPSTRIDKSSFRHLENLPLADPNFHKPGPIDLLLGAEIFASLLQPGSVGGGSKQPSAINSVFGWILLGSVGCKEEESIQTFFVKEDDLLHEQVKCLWELESFEATTRLTPDEERCEEIFVTQHSRNPSGRYIAPLPFKENNKDSSFPGSRDIALRCFHSIERKLVKNPEVQKQYSDFMKDYLDSGHMSLVPGNELNAGRYYIPHHCVLRPDAASTKLRVVFNASSKDARGTSLNDALLIGPKLQTNIVEILLNFRVHFVVFTADMRQMYRMIEIQDADRDYQRIFWRFDQTQPIQEYRLNTVTYGVSSAPFLACRTIKQLIDDEGRDLPLASKVLSSDLYIDDIVTGFNDIDTAFRAKTEIITLLKRGNFDLRKWASNAPKLLADLPPNHCLISPVTLDAKDNPTLKVLGLKWDPHSDNFFFTVTPQQRKCTKRNILSELARIFDPLGFLSPLTIVPKVLVQRLWLTNVGWDEDPPEDVVNFWNRYLEQLPLLQTLRIPRCVSVRNLKTCELHGFSDSSETGYGAVIYLRTIDVNDDVQVFFVCSKGRVAPTKSTSLPRLELCAAVLLADLLKLVKELYLPLFPCSGVFAWSDSTVVLAWIRSHPSRWKTFVANRVGHIHDVLPGARWNHVVSEDNPADVVTRGQLPLGLANNRLWWAGPSWLSQPNSSWPCSDEMPDQTTLENEEKSPHSLFTQSDPSISFLDLLLERYSSIDKIQRLLCVWIKFVEFLRHKRARCSKSVHNRTELHNALMVIVKHVQSRYFATEINQIQSGILLSKQMRKLNPFIDHRGLLRVGGRLSRSGLEFEHKYPALLPRESRLTYMIIESFHRKHCHAGVNTMQYLLTQQFWILSPKRAIRHCLSKCLQCYKLNPTPLEPFMSDLPSVRVNQVKPFSVVGTDYGGPFRIKLGKHRGAKIGKAYLCLFVCLSTKALHLETVSDLSSEAFLAALRRFVSRRGRVSIIHSDCGTNYVGASNQLHSLMQTAAHSENIEFRFNPPSSPHFGGVWEIQIKSVKSHLYRIIGEQVLTFEELSTLFAQIESMLNSRPLCPLSSDPNDLSVLTPGHFLTLEPLTSVPDEDLTSVNINRLGRWQLIQQFQQVFWNRWRQEYLQTLTQRAKWTKHSKPLNIGSVVILKIDNTVPLHWPFARVEELHASPDGIVRIATIRTVDGSRLTRPLAKLCPLPSQID